MYWACASVSSIFAKFRGMPDTCCRTCGNELEIKGFCRCSGVIMRGCAACGSPAGDDSHAECRLS